MVILKKFEGLKTFDGFKMYVVRCFILTRRGLKEDVHRIDEGLVRLASDPREYLRHFVKKSKEDSRAYWKQQFAVA